MKTIERRLADRAAKILATSRAINSILDELEFCPLSPRNGCREQHEAAVRVSVNSDDEAVEVYAFNRNRILRYEFRLPFSAPIDLIRGAIESAVANNRSSS